MTTTTRPAWLPPSTPPPVVAIATPRSQRSTAQHTVDPGMIQSAWTTLAGAGGPVDPEPRPRSARTRPRSLADDGHHDAGHNFRGRGGEDRGPPASVSTATRNLRPRSPATQVEVPARRLGTPERPHGASPERKNDVQDEDDGEVSLKAYMDSFPLVPLAVIPRLSVADLETCERGLRALAATLAPTNDEDQRLGAYIARQLALVQRHVEPARARERVQQLLRGDIAVTLAPIACDSASGGGRGMDNGGPRDKNPTATTSTTVQVGPRPQASGVTVSPSMSSPLSLPSPASTSKIEMQTRLIPPRRQDQLAKAKALVRSQTTTSFIISAGGTSHNQRRRRQRSSRRIKEQEEAARREQQEREREHRRQAAYQRLMARQRLQQHKKTAQRTAKMHSPTGGEVNRSPEIDNSSSSDSDESEVSNCSDSDEANEKAILEMPTELPTEMLTGTVTDAIIDHTGACETWEDNANSDDDGASEADRSEAGMIYSTARHGDEIGDCDYECCPSKIEVSPKDDSEEALNLAGVEVSAKGDSEESLNLAGLESPSRPHDSSLSLSPPEKYGEPQVTIQSAEEFDRQQREEIFAKIQSFVSERTKQVLNDLAHNKLADSEPDHFPTLTPKPFLSIRDHSSQDNWTLSPKIIDPNASVTVDTEVDHTDLSFDSRGSSAIMSVSTQNTLQNNGNPAQVSTILSIATPLGREAKDYRQYFPNFFCILTSAFEQRMNSTNGQHVGYRETLSHSAGGSQLAQGNASLSTENALRMQLKLFQTWQTIMSDYATVFGSNIVTPDSLLPGESPSRCHYRINSHSRKEVCDIVVTALEKMGNWDEHPSGLGLKTTWNLLWTWSKPNVERKTLLVWQKVNHFQHAKALTRKDCLKKNIGKYLAIGGRLRLAYDIIPASFLLPQEYVAFVQAYKERSARMDSSRSETQKNIWIMKPVALSRGRGISLVRDLDQVVYGEPVVIQEYIGNPLLLDGYKFDLRLYVLVTSFNPLEAFFYEDGFVRMCTRRYDDSDLQNLFIHLTNSSIQKNNQEALEGSEQDPANPIHANCGGTEASGTKLTLDYLWSRLSSMGADVEKVKNDIFAVILKSLICGEDHIPYQVNSFDLLGYDILLDTNFRPWLIEINSSPSMARENELDYQVKDALIFDTLRLVNPLKFDRSKLVEVLKRRFHDADVDRRRAHVNTRHPREAEELAARQMNQDLTEILDGEVPRQYGELPQHMGRYTRLCPHTSLFNQLVKLKRSCLRLDHK